MLGCTWHPPHSRASAKLRAHPITTRFPPGAEVRKAAQAGGEIREVIYGRDRCDEVIVILWKRIG
jgi:hypothetical protein